ncbi:MAG: hypothetical protein ACTSWY_10200 [Promethearchaeota archaeon]
MIFSRKALLPSTLSFLISTILLTLLKVLLVDITFLTALTGNKVFWVAIDAGVLYFFVFFLLSLSTSTSKLIFRRSQFFSSLLLGTLWFGAIFVILWFVNSSILTSIFFYVIIIGSLIWIIIQSLVVNSNVLETAGFKKKKKKFSFLRFAVGLILIGSTYVAIFYISQILPFFYYWCILCSVFMLFAIIIPKKTLHTAIFFFLIFLYFMIAFLYYIFSGSITTNQIVLWIISIVQLIIKYAIFFVAVGRIGAMAGSGTRITNHKKFRTLTLFACFLSYSFLVFEYTIYHLPSWFPDPELFIILSKLYFVWLTAVGVYLYFALKKK